MPLRHFLKSGKKIVLKDNKTLVEIVSAKVFSNSIKKPSRRDARLVFYGTCEPNAKAGTAPGVTLDEPAPNRLHTFIRFL